MLLLFSHRLHHLVLCQLVLALLLVLLSLELLLLMLLLLLNGYLWVLKQLQHVVVGHRVAWFPLMK